MSLCGKFGVPRSLVDGSTGPLQRMGEREALLTLCLAVCMETSPTLLKHAICGWKETCWACIALSNPNNPLVHHRALHLTMAPRKRNRTGSSAVVILSVGTKSATGRALRNPEADAACGPQAKSNTQKYTKRLIKISETGGVRRRSRGCPGPRPGGGIAIVAS
jgi:hypothetical protein